MVVIAPGGKIHEGYAFLGTATNNVAEITGVLLSLEAMPEAADSVAIHTDSKYTIGVLSLGWKAKVNGELIRRTREVLTRFRARFVYVPGHAGVPMNERADELAREAVRRAASLPLPKLDRELA
jgi:ribonuclease HI